MQKVAAILLAASLLTGCAFHRQKGGSNTVRHEGSEIVLQQSENPKDASTQEIERIVEHGNVKTTERVKTRIGAAQKDYVAETAAKLASMRPVMYVGILLVLFGLASLFWPLLKMIVGSTTTSVMCVVAGGALIVLPSLVVGNEILILCVGVGAVALYWFSHRHGELRGAIRGLDANSNPK